MTIQQNEIKTINFKELLEKCTTEAAEIISREDASVLAKEAESITVDSVKTLGRAGDVLKILKTKIKWLDDTRKTFTSPWDDIKKQIKIKFDKVIDPLEVIKTFLDKKMYIFQAAETRRRELIEIKRKADEQLALEQYKQSILDAAAETGNAETLDEALAVEVEQSVLAAEPVKIEPVRATGDISKIQYRDSWKFEIVNEALVPLNLKCVDEAKIKDLIKNGAREIAGLRIYNIPYSVSK